MSKASKKNPKRKQQGVEQGVSDLLGDAPTSSESGSASESSVNDGVKPGEDPSRVLKGPGSKNDSGRCKATAHRTGERCRAPSMKGGTCCRVHGGAAPQVKKAARERLLEMVEPAMVQLRRIIDKPDTSDADKLRGIQMILDRTGYKPGMVIEVKEHDPWSSLTDDALVMDRTEVNAGPRAELGAKANAVEQFSMDATAENWREYDHEDAEPYVNRIEPNLNTVTGQVIDTNPPSPIRFGDEGPRPPGTSEFDPTPSGPYGQPAKTRIEQIQETLEAQARDDRRGRR